MEDTKEKEEEHDSKGVRLFYVGKERKSQLKQSFTAALPNATRMQIRDKFGTPNLPFTSVVYSTFHPNSHQRHTAIELDLVIVIYNVYIGIEEERHGSKQP